MKLIISTLIVALSGLLTTNYCQDLPQASPKGKVEQAIGLTHISIEYSRPSVKGRKIFGELVPFNEVWRLGANAATTITTDQYLKFGDQLLNPGTYAMFATPAEEKWVISFNSNYEQWGTGDYDQEKNVVTLDVEIAESSFTETLEIGINDITMNSGSITISWDQVMIALPFKVETKAQAKKNIEEAIEKGVDLDKVHYNAARYYLTLEDYKTAMSHIDKSIELKEAHNNLFYKARILVATGDKSKAIEFGKKALKLANENNKEGWAEYIQESLDEWSND